MKQSNVMYTLAALAFCAAGCASSATSVPPVDVSSTGHACAAPGAVVTTDTSVRSGGARGPQTPTANLDPLVLQGRGVTTAQADGTPARTVARTEFRSGGIVNCD
jgi:hypothetical protein